MNRLNNQHWIEFDGAPRTGRTPPRLCVYGPEMTADQAAQVRQAYKLFTDACLVATGDYQVRRRTLADGTRVRCTSWNGQDFVGVWTQGGSPCPELETLFFGTPVSYSYFGGMPEQEVCVWREYHKTEPPEALEPYAALVDRPGNVTWHNPEIKLTPATGCPQDIVGAVVVSWRGPAHRYGAYGSAQSNALTFMTEAKHPRLDDATAPGSDYPADSWQPAPAVWINAVKYAVSQPVLSAALRKIEGAGLHLYVTSRTSGSSIAIWRGQINLPRDGSVDGGEVALEKVSDVDLPADSSIWQTPYFNVSGTKLSFIADFNVGTAVESRVVEASVDSGGYNTLFSGSWTQSSSASSSTAAVTGEAYSSLSSTIVYTPYTVKSIWKYPLAADFEGDAISYVIATVQYAYGHEGGTESVTSLSNYGTPTYQHLSGPYGPPKHEYNLESATLVTNASASVSRNFSDGFNALNVLVEGNITGTIFEYEDRRLGSYSFTGAVSEVLVTTWQVKRFIASGTIETVPDTSSQTSSRSVSVSGGEISWTFESTPKVGLVAGDIRCGAFVFSISGLDRRTAKELSFSNWLADSHPVQWGGGGGGALGGYAMFYCTAAGSEQYITEMPVKYAVVHNKQVLLEEAGFIVEPSVTDFAIAPYATYVSASYRNGSGTISGEGSEQTTPYRTPVSQPIRLLSMPGAVNYSPEFNDKLAARNANNQPGAYARIAFSPTKAEDGVVGYIGWGSPQLRNEQGESIGRKTFEKFYIKRNDNAQWLSAESYIPGSTPTIAGAVFVGTRPKRKP